MVFCHKYTVLGWKPHKFQHKGRWGPKNQEKSSRKIWMTPGGHKKGKIVRKTVKIGGHTHISSQKLTFIPSPFLCLRENHPDAL